MTAEDAMRVLIVDDEADMREMLCDLIESAGLMAVAVEDGVAMRAELAAGGYSLLILDLRLNREDGLTLARSVRANSAIPIIILSGKGDETDRILGLELAADDYLMKPFNPRELIARVRALLRRANIAAARSRARLIRSEILKFPAQEHLIDFRTGRRHIEVHHRRMRRIRIVAGLHGIQISRALCILRRDCRFGRYAFQRTGHIRRLSCNLNGHI